jgi:hypothetical protein
LKAEGLAEITVAQFDRETFHGISLWIVAARGWFLW